MATAVGASAAVIGAAPVRAAAAVSGQSSAFNLFSYLSILAATAAPRGAEGAGVRESSRWDRYLGMTAPMTQVPVPTAT